MANGEEKIILSMSSTENDAGYMILLFSLLPIWIIYSIIHNIFVPYFLSTLSIEMFVFFIAILLLFFAFFLVLLDEAIWEIKGTEIISNDSTCIYIFKKKLFNTRKSIEWNKIKNICSYKRKGIFTFLSQFTINGNSNSFSICIITQNNKKNKVGLNLSHKKKSSLILDIQQLKIKYSV